MPARVRRGQVIAFLFLLTILCLAPRVQLRAQSQLTDQVLDRLRGRIEGSALTGQIEVGDEPIYASQSLPTFYERHGCRPAWITNHGADPRIDSLLHAIDAASEHGLNREDYHSERLQHALKTARRTGPDTAFARARR
jgi:hypothetical protein